nr:photosystem I subunit IX [Astragalus sinicus]
MRDLKTYLSVASVVSALWLTFLAALWIEINRMFPEPRFIFRFFS